MEYIMGRWAKMKIRCDKCGQINPHGLTYVVNHEKLKGRFCSDRHAKDALQEMNKDVKV